MKKLHYLIAVLLLSVIYVSCQQDEFLTNEDKEITKQNSNLPKTTLRVLNQSQVRQKFGKESNANSSVNFNSVKANGVYNNFVIDTEYINSIEGENFHSLTYLVTYPENPNLYVNLIFFSNDFVHYHPVIYKYNLSAAELKRDIIINKDKIFPIRIGEGQNYLDALAGIPQTTNIDVNDPCVVTYWREVPHKCKDDAHLPGDGRCIYIGTGGEAYTTYKFVIDVSGCGGGPGGGGPGGPGNGGNPGGGYVGIDDPGNASNPGQHYQNPWLGNPGGGNGGWQPADPVITLPNLPLPGRINVSFFKNGLNSTQLKWWNNTTETDQRAGLYDYIYKGGNFAFAEWAIDFFIENPDTTWEQFENWFMMKSEGKDFFYDANYWENPNLTFQQQSLPTWAAFSAAYPNETSAQLYGVVGDEVAQAQIDHPLLTQNGCALKVSRALNYSGVTIPFIPTTSTMPGTLQGADGKYYFLNAQALIIWMKKTFGTTNNPNYIHKDLDDYQGSDNQYGKGFKADVLSKKGIFAMFPIDPGPQNLGGFGASGHCDKFDGVDCKAGCYFQDAAEIFFWELN